MSDVPAAPNPDDIKNASTTSLNSDGSTGSIQGTVPPVTPENIEGVEAYEPEKQRDWVRATVTIGLLVIFGWVVLWASIETASWPAHWEQTKEMLQVILPAITGLIGSALGFYFGTSSATGAQSK
jgi:hypothetical protein